MACNHERLRCTDNRYFCAVCGAFLFDVNNEQAAEKPAPEAKKTTNKRKTKKDGE